LKALIYESHGADVLEYTDVADPVPWSSDVVVEVAASTVNHLDTLQRNGWFTMPGFSLPHISGMDVVGTVIELGKNVTRVTEGDRVVIDPSLASVPEDSSLSGRGDLYGELGIIGANADGGYAEKCLAPETHLHLIPDEMSWHQAAMFPTAWMTAHHALFDVASLTSGESVMIHAAGSGVSMAGIQLAKQAGATVLATAGSEEKCQKAIEIGADFACNNRETDLAKWAKERTDGRGVNVVFDHVGEALWASSMFALAPRGRLVNCGGTSGNSPVIPNLGYMYHMGLQLLGSDPWRHEEFAPAWKSYCEGDFESVADSVFHLSEGKAAQEKLLGGNFFGKIILEP
jgi:NADPH:quinone reductase-like Zn-dependent oxidoreductase